MMDAMQRMGEVRAEHKQLDYFVGDWSATTTMWMDPKAPPQKSSGKVHTQAIFGGRYIEVDMEGAMNDATYHGRGYMGYDNIAFTEFGAQDVVRHPLVARIIDAYEKNTQEE